MESTKGEDQLSEEIVILSVEGYVVLFEVLIESLCAQNLRDLHQLVVVIVPVEEWLFAEDLHTDKVSPDTKYLYRGEQFNRVAFTIEANMHP
jgi:hypothetical protein